MTDSFDATGTGRTGAVQQWQAPASAYYRITAAGAQGGTGSREGVGGRGALVAGNFWLEAGQNLDLLIGQAGAITGNDVGPSGGGASFVVRSATPAGGQAILYHQRHATPVAFDTALIDYLEAQGHTVTVDHSDLTGQDLDAYDLLIVGSHATAAFEAPAGADAIAQYDGPALSFCRHTTRFALRAPAENSAHSNRASATAVDRPDLWAPAVQDITFPTQGVQEIASFDDALAGFAILETGTGGQPYGVTDYRNPITGRNVVHFGLYEFDKATPEIEALLDQAIQVVMTEAVPLAVAGGGGGFGVGDTAEEQWRAHGTLTRDGRDGFGTTAAGDGGSNGSGGTRGGNNDRSSGGGGWRGPGQGADPYDETAGGQAYSIGAAAGGQGEDGYADGGYGGGGGLVLNTSWGACSGGGGWSGGGAGYAGNAEAESAGGGGGSYLRGALLEPVLQAVDGGNLRALDPYGAEGENDGHGWVQIAQLGYLQGTVHDIEDEPVEGRQVRIYDRETGEHRGTEATDAAGFWRWEGGYTGREYYVVAIHDSPDAQDYAPPAANRLTPVVDV